MASVSEWVDSTFAVILTEGEDGWVCAQIAEVPEAISQGRNATEAKANVAEALTAAIEWRIADGEAIPAASDVRVEPLTLRV